MPENLTFYALTGPSFAGKTSLGIPLAEATGSKYISGTQVARDLGLPTAQRYLEPEERQRLIAEHRRRTVETLSQGTSVVHDGANSTKERRDALRKLAEIHQADHTLILVTTPWEVIEDRWKKNQSKPPEQQRSVPPLELVKTVYDNYQPPHLPEEPHLVFYGTNDTPLSWIQQHAQDLGIQKGKKTK